jgi:hypothetical protein
MKIEQTYNLYGYRFAFRTDQPRAAEWLSDLYSGRTETATGPSDKIYELLHRVGARGDRQWTIQLPGLDLQVKPSFGDCLARVEAAIATDLCRQINGLHVIHGAVVYAPEGDILISGYSGAGKTTLSLALAARGLRLGGDDIAVLDPASNLVEPVPRCFHIDEQSVALLAAVGLSLPQEALQNQFVTPRHLGVVQPPPALIRFVFLLEAERISVPKLVPQTQAEMTSALLEQTGRGRFSHIEGVNAMVQMVGRCRCHRVWSGELGATVDAVLGVVKGSLL